MTDEADSDYFVREGYCYSWKKNHVEFLYPGDEDVFIPGTCWATSCSKRTSIVEKQCEKYAPTCEDSRPTNCDVSDSKNYDLNDF